MPGLETGDLRGQHTIAVWR